MDCSCDRDSGMAWGIFGGMLSGLLLGDVALGMLLGAVCGLLGVPCGKRR